MNEAEYLMKNYGDRGGCYPSRPLIQKSNSITEFFNSCILFIDAMFITEPAISSTLILGLGSKLYPSNMQFACSTKILLDLCRVFLKNGKI